MDAPAYLSCLQLSMRIAVNRGDNAVSPYRKPVADVRAGILLLRTHYSACRHRSMIILTKLEGRNAAISANLLKPAFKLNGCGE